MHEHDAEYELRTLTAAHRKLRGWDITGALKQLEELDANLSTLEEIEWQLDSRYKINLEDLYDRYLTEESDDDLFAESKAQRIRNELLKQADRIEIINNQNNEPDSSLTTMIELMRRVAKRFELGTDWGFKAFDREFDDSVMHRAYTLRNIVYSIMESVNFKQEFFDWQNEQHRRARNQ